MISRLEVESGFCELVGFFVPCTEKKVHLGYIFTPRHARYFYPVYTSFRSTYTLFLKSECKITPGCITTPLNGIQRKEKCTFTLS
jgi:hypothetical protein